MLLVPELSRLPAVLRELEASEEATYRLRCRLARQQNDAGLSDDDRQRRAALAAELYRQADAVVVSPAASDRYSSGWELAAAAVARHLRKRAAAVTA